MYSTEPMHEVMARSRRLMLETAKRMYPGLFDLSQASQPSSDEGSAAALRWTSEQAPLRSVTPSERRDDPSAIGKPSGKTPTAR